MANCIGKRRAAWVAGARDLNDLHAALNAECPARAADDLKTPCSCEHFVPYDSLPTFGGPAPDDTTAIWSWDERRLLVGECAPFDLVARPAELPAGGETRHTWRRRDLVRQAG